MAGNETTTLSEAIGPEADDTASTLNGGSSETIGISCPTCGGSLRLHEGERSLRCEYCHSALYVHRPRGARSFILQPSITAGKARLAALHYLSRETEGRIRARHASILDLRLIHVPFWRMHGRLVGWAAGEKAFKREIEVVAPGPDGPQVRKSYRVEYHPFSKLIFKEIDWSTPACALRHLGLQGISLKTQFLNWDIFNHDLKKKLPIALAMKPMQNAEKDGFNYLSRLTFPPGSKVRGQRFKLFGNDLSLYYYPVYILRYRHGGRIYSITIDGNNAHVIRGDFPLRKKINVRSLFFVPALGAILAGTWFPLVPIAAVALYIFDMVQNGEIIPPLRWMACRLENWFGGEW
ncbi:MAG: hypothetical protein JXB45_06170 [Candidatus Krumholzibacteriota bacterium]|nr:hypothetical protein [Candidatus Krumholzibacteriota bacterium]